MTPRLLPPVKYLRECFVYERKTGCLFWKKRPLRHFSGRTAWKKWNTRYAGTKAFITVVKGYRYSSIDGVRYAAHRVIWKLETKKEPPVMLDHEDRRRGNNCFTNLRSASYSQNMSNTSRRTLNSSGRQGVYWRSGRQRWYAYLTKNRVQIWLGSFKKRSAAVQARTVAEQRYFGEFAS